PASAGGLRLADHCDLTWRLQGEQRDGDRSSRGSGHPGESDDAQTSRSCSGPDPRNPSRPAVPPTAHTGRTHDRKRRDPFAPPNLANRGPSTHGFRAHPLRGIPEGHSLAGGDPRGKRTAKSITAVLLNTAGRAA